MQNPTITLVIPAYNRAHLIVATINSALSQTSLFDEIIIVDDASTDGTIEVLRQFGEKVKVIPSAKVGVQLARNIGVTSAMSTFICLCDSDDLLEPTYVETMKSWLMRHLDNDIIYSNFITFDSKSLSLD